MSVVRWSGPVGTWVMWWNGVTWVVNPNFTMQVTR